MTPKFRVFIKETGEIKDVKLIHLVVKVLATSDDKMYQFEDVVLMQSTGLFDIHGVEIFEGSVVKHSDGEYSYIGHVDRDCYVFWIRGIDPDDNFNFEDMADTSTGIASIEVIGDIYSNPEFLEVIK